MLQRIAAIADALDNLAQAYVSVYGEKEGMEKMCDNFFEDAARQLPGRLAWCGNRPMVTRCRILAAPAVTKTTLVTPRRARSARAVTKPW